MQPIAPRLSKFLLEQQLLDTSKGSGIFSGAKNKNGSSNNDNSNNNNNASTMSGTDSGAAEAAGGILGNTKRVVSALDHVTQVTLETCHCIHLQEFLPHLLDLDLVKNSQSPEWDVENPIHALHLASQMDSITKSSRPKPNHPPPPPHQPPLLYGEEQQRTLALSTEGIVEYWCPLDGRSSVIDDVVPVMKKDPGLSSSPSGSTVESEVLPSHSRQPSLVRSLSSAAPPASTSGATSNMAPPKTLSSPAEGSATIPPPSGSSSVPPNATPKSESGTQGNVHVKPGTVPSGSGETKPDDPASIPSSANSNASETKSNTPSAPSAVTSGKNDNVAEPSQQSQPLGSANPKTNMSAATSAIDTPLAQAPPDQDDSSPLSEHRFNQLRIEEDRLRTIRRMLSSKRFKKKPTPKKKKQQQQQHQARDSSSSSTGEFFKIPGLQGLNNNSSSSASKKRSPEEQDEWEEVATMARTKVELWMDTFRLCRQSGLDEKEQLRKSHRCRRQEQQHGPTSSQRSFFQLEDQPQDVLRCCQVCVAQPNGNRIWIEDSKKRRKRQHYPDAGFTADDLMQCLECSFIGCMPSSVAPNSRQHILQHLLLSGHSFAISCGERAQVFCFKCGDFVYHPIFSQESERLDCVGKLPWMAWKDHTVQRSFDAFQFLRTQDHGIVWRGLVATYPPLVPREHVQATSLSLKRHALFEGLVQEKWLIQRPAALAFTASQRLREPNDRCRIMAPVGMYNLGNTCFQSSILQCLVHCVPLQRYFIKGVGHNHRTCSIYRQKFAAGMGGKRTPLQKAEDSKITSVCLACEMDRLFLQYYGSSVGRDATYAITDASRPPSIEFSAGSSNDHRIMKGEPLITSDLLTAAWKCGGMDHLAGYEQRDAHEFLTSFLDMMGKDTRHHRERISRAINAGRSDNAVVTMTDKTENDIIKDLFEGTLRSVLLCEECGGKRMLIEPFMNISLTLSEEVERLSGLNLPGRRGGHLSVQTCLDHFILPEKLSDPVDCPSCGKKTPTKKQQTFAKLPKVLCLHLKRFDAARNRKIDEYVSFPAKGLNMGPLLSHWSEISRAPTEDPANLTSTSPQCLYDLFGTVNHVGSLESGHYVSNVNVDGSWFHINDAHVSRAGVGSGETAVLSNEGAYVLFYSRRQL